MRIRTLYLFHQSMVRFLGYIVLDDGISMDEKKI
jgi:hypothetical protein